MAAIARITKPARIRTQQLYRLTLSRGRRGYLFCFQFGELKIRPDRETTLGPAYWAAAAARTKELIGLREPGRPCRVKYKEAGERYRPAIVARVEVLTNGL